MISTISSWLQFRHFVANAAIHNLRHIYRGQSNASWSLISSWHRLTGESQLGTYWQLLDHVHDHVSTWANRTWDLRNSEEVGPFLGFLQHNGFPTPLLDWSRSPYIAAYFAYEGVNDQNPANEYCKVFAFDYLRFQSDWQQIYDPFSATRHVSILETFSRGNQKQVIQQGLYTFANVYDQAQHVASLEMQARASTGASPYMLEIRLPVSEKPIAMRELRLMGITAASLFPTIEGVCKGLREELFAAAAIGESPRQTLQQLIGTMEKEREIEGGQPDLPLPAEG